MTDEEKGYRRIRSFVRREGRLTLGQERALTELFPRVGVDLQAGALDFSRLFQREAPVALEIGFGNGASLLEMAANKPEWNFLGIEVHRPGVGHLLSGMEKQGLSNLRVSCDDAKEVLQQQIPDNSLAAVYLFFPDPWHKKRHNKRRLVQPDFTQLVAKKLSEGGVFHAATDWEHYAEHILQVCDASTSLQNEAGASQYAKKPAYRPLTKFEQRGLSLGHHVFDLLYRKSNN